MIVTRLDGALLDFWVAKSEGLKLLNSLPEGSEQDIIGSGFWHPNFYRPSTNWSQGGPIVSNEWYDLEGVLIEWFGQAWPMVKAVADEPLKWMMRAYVATKFGNQVEILEEHEFQPPPILEAHEFQPSASAKKWPSWFGRVRDGGISGY